MSTDAMIQVTGLEHTYRHGGVVEPVLRGLELTVRSGEFVVIMGPSGCGKTTLLNIIGLMMRPTAADAVQIAGQNVLMLSDAGRTRLRRQAIGFVFQRFNLLPTINVRRNVELPLRLAGITPDHQAQALLDRVGVGVLARKKPAQLSMGQQQRVALARAIVAQPKLLLADEPTGNLDSANAQQVLDLLGELHAGGQTIVMITHNENLAVTADRVLRMQDGRFVD